jgi:hypothetical protein
VALQRGKVMALPWKRKKSVVLLSMTYNVQMVDVGDNKKKKTKLQVVTDYNDRMEEGKLCRPALIRLPCTSKTRKEVLYHKYILSYIFELAI